MKEAATFREHAEERTAGVERMGTRKHRRIFWKLDRDSFFPSITSVLLKKGGFRHMDFVGRAILFLGDKTAPPAKLILPSSFGETHDSICFAGIRPDDLSAPTLLKSNRTRSMSQRLGIGFTNLYVLSTPRDVKPLRLGHIQSAAVGLHVTRARTHHEASGAGKWSHAGRPATTAPQHTKAGVDRTPPGRRWGGWSDPSHPGGGGSNPHQDWWGFGAGSTPTPTRQY